MKQIPQEIREKIFALYWGQTILIYDDTEYPFNVLGHTIEIRDSYLFLTPLHLITDEDAIEVGKMLEYAGKITRWQREYYVEIGKDYIEDSGHNCYKLRITDFLRSRGYALPYLNFSVDDLVESGIYKLKTEVK